MISILIPTKGRPEKLERCVKSVDIYCEIWILATKPEDVPHDVMIDSRVKVFFDENMTIIQAQNFLASKATGHILPITDDIVFDRGSIDAALDILYCSFFNFDGDGIVGFHVKNMNCADYAYMLVGKRFYNETLKGELFHSGYEHFFADQELSEIAKKRKKFVVCLDATIKNYHPNAGFQEDETHRYRRGEKLAHDQELYRRRVLHGQIPA